MEDNKWKKGSIVVHKASKEQMVVLETNSDYQDLVWCRYFNRLDGHYCEKQFKKFEFE